ncbi:MAG: B12-binding domain-containing radical SAM protein, partial [Deltaproteobacteria bacterium]|nr:B12-binding domain-containing radical SAM protein [Deltaproteobacteria bacterium]
MKFLLINPAGDLRKIPNLGLGYLSSALKSNGFESRIGDRHQIGGNGRNFIETISSGAWDFVGFQTYSAMVPETLRLAGIVKKARKETIVAAGGTHPSALPEDLLFEGSPVDYVFAGEAEKSLLEFAKAAGDRGRLKGIGGVAFRNWNGGIRQAKPDYAADLDDIPFPDWDEISPLKYPVSPIGAFYRALPSAPILTSRGCPFGCKYCASHSVVGNIVRVRSSSNIAEEIDMLERKFGVRELQILDDNFTLKKEHAMSVCEMLA